MTYIRPILDGTDGNKEALIAKIAMLEAEELTALEEEISGVRDPTGALERFVALYIDYCCRPENATLAAEITSEAMRNPSIGVGFTKNRLRLNALTSTLIERMAEQDGAVTRLKPQECSAFILDLIEGLAARAAFEGRKPRRSETRALKTAIQRLTSAC